MNDWNVAELLEAMSRQEGGKAAEDGNAQECDGAGEALQMEEEMLPVVEEREPMRQKGGESAGQGVEELCREMALRSAIRMVQQNGRAKQMVMREAARQAFLQRDAQDFKEKHPEVDLMKLNENQNFLRFCGSRYGVESLAKLYDDYKEIVGGAESAARAAVEHRSKRSTGSGGGGGDILTAKQRASLEAWNRANPDMKMTAKEFLKN